jgi:serine/threonine protein kinase
MKISTGITVGSYRLVEQLGQGGMASVFKGVHTVLDRSAALKFMHPGFLEDPEFTQRFRREARLIASLDHPNIVEVFDYAEHEGVPYLVMKFVEGETLRSRQRRGKVPREETGRIMKAIGSALSYAHGRGILHRDVKPANVLLGSDGSILLADFGLARLLASSQSTFSSEMMIGTPQYIPPEQARSEPDLDARADIYSLGVVLYELIVGSVPFDSDSPISIIHDHLNTPPTPPREIAPEVSVELEAVILRSLAKKKWDRFASVDEMMTAFAEAERVAEIGTGAGSDSDSPALDLADAGNHQFGVVEGGPDIQTTLSGTTSRPANPVLVCPGGPSFPVVSDRLLIGRADPKSGLSPDIDLAEAEPLDPGSHKRRRTVHREQAWIKQVGGRWAVEVIPGKEDRAWLNGERMGAGREYYLVEGDILKFGEVELALRF